MSDGERFTPSAPSDHPACHRAAKSHEDPQAVENFRRKLKYFFMSPCQKYRARGRKPWKMMLQILKIAIITFQLVSFGLSNEMMVTFKEENIVAFKHLFLKNYQERNKDYALYTRDEVHDHILYIINRYLHLQNLTVDNHAFERTDGVLTPLSICQDLYQHANVLPANETFDIDPHVETECVSIYPISLYKEGDLEKDMNITLDFQRLLAVNIYLKVKAINLQTVRHKELPDCYDFSINIKFDNRAHSGQIKISLSSDVQIKVCKDWNVSGSNLHYQLIVLFDCVVICSCLLSLILCTRSVYNGVLLLLEYIRFASNNHRRRVGWSERAEFINGWYILIVASDTLTIAGSVLKICIQSKELTNYDVCSILLGIATMLAWIGVMRYLSFFQKYYILILTLQAALPNVLRFSFCAVMIFLSYCFCGWIVLGPHNDNFRSFNMVANCLFSMINGDEIYSTFTKIRGKSDLVWMFSRMYIYSFVPLFTFMITSLFIALFTDTYETIKKYQEHGAPPSELQAFIDACKDPPSSGKYVVDDESSTFWCLCAPCVNCT
ncbi:mucolipin-3 isoform X2 [Puntigrus tetrazona]|uniref:mucolipin-3 isoform X2 n=1 Tax=Puntigrus tetrazona TaxID=1606681 RepID=UPI001C89EC81|nr:mucolipin-3 isoform X2 [Puntigrus tetrazona]